jgi:hypothetical protein
MLVDAMCAAAALQAAMAQSLLHQITPNHLSAATCALAAHAAPAALTALLCKLVAPCLLAAAREFGWQSAQSAFLQVSVVVLRFGPFAHTCRV